MDVESPSPETVHRSPHTFEMVDRIVQEPDKDHRTIYAPAPGGPKQVSLDDVEIGMEAYETSPNALFNSSTPNFAILHEKPEHRIIVYLKAQGLSNREIATRTGYKEPWVSQITRQPWFRLRLVNELKEAGVDVVASTIRAAALDSVFDIIDIRDDSETPKAVRLAANKEILDRFLGKPTQKVETTEHKLPSTEEIRSVDRQLAEIDKQLETANQVPTQNGQTQI